MGQLTITETQKGYEISTGGYSEEKRKDLNAIEGARWYKDRQIWFVPRWRKEQVDKLKDKYGIMVDPVVQMKEQYFDIPPLPELTIDLKLNKQLYPFQGPGIAYGLQNKKIICADQQGLGKTLQAIGMAIGAGCKCILVICPATLKLNWQREWQEVAGIDAMILDDKYKSSWTNFYKIGLNKVFICNYESLKKFFVKTGWKKPAKDDEFRLNTIPFKECINLFDCVIVDESTKCKDGTKQQTKITAGICKGKEYVIALTGTPVVNKPVDLVSQLIVIDRLRDVVDHIPHPIENYKRTDWSGYNRFLNRYCDGGRGARNLKELNYRLNARGIMYRRLKSEVLKDLPEKIRQVILCEITNRDEYTEVEKEFKLFIKKAFATDDEAMKRKLRGQILVQIAMLKQMSARGKIEAACEHIDEVIEGGEKIIVFAHLKEITQHLKRKYNALSIVGDDSMEDRQAAIDRFQGCGICGENHAKAYPVARNGIIVYEPKVFDHESVPSEDKVIICSLTAAGMGVTLTASTEVLFVEFPWTYAICEQAEDRAHRIGQKGSVRCAYLLGEKTIDRYCYDLIQKKKDIHNQVTGSNDNIKDDVIDTLYNLFNQG